MPESRFDGGDWTKVDNRPFVFPGKVADQALNAAVAWQLSRDRELAEKVAVFLRRFTDPDTGYPATLRASDAALVQEGGFLRRTANAFDLIKDSDVLTLELTEQIERTFHLYEDVVMNELRRGVVGNHQVSAAAGGLYAALTINDMGMAHRFIHGPGMLMDMFTVGFMPDGWWHESALNYSTGMTLVYLKLARALEPRGIDWLNKGFPVKYSQALRIDPSAAGDPTKAGDGSS